MHSSLLLIIAGILGGLGAWEIILIVVIVLLFFRGNKIPEIMKGVGKGIRGFREGVKGIEDEINDPGGKEKETKSNDDPGKEKSPGG